MKLPDLPSLNRPEVRTLAQRIQLFPYEMTGVHREAVLGFRYNAPSKENRNRASFRAKVKILDSDNKMAPGRVYTFIFPINGEPNRRDYADRDQAAFVAACVGQRPDDPTFDIDEARQMLVDTDEKGGFDDESCQIIHTRTSKTKEMPNTVAAIKAGGPALIQKTFANDYFDRV